jgi:methylphosphotriester-DNA--protein-cysteine methyltransferase
MIEKVLGKGKVEEKKEAKEEKPEAPKEGKKPERYMTSAKAKRFHLETCPFAAKIQEAQRIYFTLEEAEKAGYKPCKCTGLLGKAPEEVGREAVKKAKKEKFESKAVKKPKKAGKKETEEASEEESKDESSLDDISKLLTGK